MSKVGTVYALFHRPTWKFYVGSTRDLKTRIETHISKLRNGNHPNNQMQADFNTYGDDYELYVLFEDEVSDSALLALEHCYMEILHSRDILTGYNGRDPSTPFAIENCRKIQIPPHGVRRAIEVRPLCLVKPMKLATVKPMHEKEKRLIELISQMPPEAQDKFLAQAQGAVIMLDALEGKSEKKGVKNDAGD